MTGDLCNSDTVIGEIAKGYIFEFAKKIHIIGMRIYEVIPVFRRMG